MARRGENIYKRKDGRWEGRFVKARVDGKTKFGSVFGRTYRETKEKLAAARATWNEEKTKEEEKQVRLETVGQSWIDDSKVFLKESTVAKYADYLRCYIVRMADITDTDISDFCLNLLKNGGSKGQGLSEKTVSEINRVLKNLRKYSIKHGYKVGYSDDPITIRQKQSTLRVFTHGEQTILCDWLENHPTLYNVGILICLYTGIRIGELCALKWENISLAENLLHISHTLQRVRNTEDDGPKTKIVFTPPKSICSVRDIPLPEILRSYLVTDSDGEAYFLTGTEKFVEPRVMQNRFKKILKDAGIEDANFHTLRHTFATNCVEVGFDIKCLSEILGHSSVNITLNRYVHPTMSLKQTNMSRLVKD